jgi:uncharacterized protein (TIGR02594 family)
MKLPLQHGDHGRDVQILQSLLALHGVFAGSIEGNLLTITENAVRNFQRAHNLEIDGVVGPLTWDKLITGIPSLPSIATIEPTWFTIAKTEVGESEIAGGKHNPRIIEYHTATSLKATSDEVSWCAAFVCWCLHKAGHASPRSAAARSFLDWGKPTNAPSVGDVTVFWRESPSSWKGHVAFYVEQDGNYVRVLGGNQGNMVKVASYHKSYVLGYRKLATT